MPRLWEETIEAHRQAVRDAALDATATVVADEGLASVTMSRIAEKTGIGRATLYKYFADIDEILVAWHERQVNAHLEQLTKVREGANPGNRLEAVLDAYARLSHRHGGNELAAALHRGEHVAHAERRLHDFIRALLAEGAAAGALRSDVAADELASYCLHALTAAMELKSPAAVKRLVAVTVAGLRPPAA